MLQIGTHACGVGCALCWAQVTPAGIEHRSSWKEGPGATTTLDRPVDDTLFGLPKMLRRLSEVAAFQDFFLRVQKIIGAAFGQM